MSRRFLNECPFSDELVKELSQLFLGLGCDFKKFCNITGPENRYVQKVSVENGDVITRIYLTNTITKETKLLSISTNFAAKYHFHHFLTDKLSSDYFLDNLRNYPEELGLHNKFVSTILFVFSELAEKYCNTNLDLYEETKLQKLD